MTHDGLDVTSPWGNVKGFPTSLLGWLVSAGIAIYLAHGMVAAFDHRVGGIEIALKEQTVILRELRDTVRAYHPPK